MRSRHPTVDGIVLKPGLPFEQFLLVVIFDHETAARFTLDWAKTDWTAAADYLGRFLAKVHHDLRTDGFGSEGHYLPARPGVATTFGNRRPSTSYIAFGQFRELLFENPDFWRQCRPSPTTLARLVITTTSRTATRIASRSSAGMGGARGHIFFSTPVRCLPPQEQRTRKVSANDKSDMTRPKRRRKPNAWPPRRRGGWQLSNA